MLRVACVSTLVMLAACPAGDDAVDPDAAPPRGLRVAWTTSPPVPGAVSADLSVSLVQLELSSMRAVGDAAPGDGRTTASDVELRWDQESVADAVLFPDAPAGLYARLELGSGGDDEHYELRGQVTVGGEDFDFRIIDEAPLSISVDVDVAVTANAVAEIGVVFDAGAVLAAVPFEQVEPDDNELRIEAGDPEIAAIRASLASAFRAAP